MILKLVKHPNKKMTSIQKKCGFCREIGHNISTCNELGKSKECSICLNPISKIKNSIITPCKHSFCFTCFIKWNHQNNTCPVCRRRVSPRPREKFVYIETEVERIVEVPFPIYTYYKNKIINLNIINKKMIQLFCISFIIVYSITMLINFVKSYIQNQKEKE